MEIRTKIIKEKLADSMSLSDEQEGILVQMQFLP
jgi:hypothetical protein